METPTYLCIDLKSFYASVECVDRGLDPLTTNLVVADASRTEKTICLAVSPSLKAYNIPGRARLFEVIQQINQVNANRLNKAPQRKFIASSYNAIELSSHPELEVSYITAPPRMAYYMDYSTRVYQVYLKYVAPKDIHIYSIDEVFIDLTHYLSSSGMSAHAFARMIIDDVLKTTKITATAGIGTNLYLAKIAMDIVAKHIPADKDGVRIAELDEASYRQQLWDHQPITDFWRVGRGYAKKLAQYNMFTMGDIARCSVGKPYELRNEELLYKLFGINAELLIDHAWGWEPCTIEDIKAYKPSSNSIGSGQVLHCAYPSDKAKLVVREMTDLLVLDLVDKGLVTDQMVLTVGYDIDNLKGNYTYNGPISNDAYGRKIPKHAHGSANIGKHTSSTKLITDTVMDLFDRIVDNTLLVRRINLVANHVILEESVHHTEQVEQLDFFTDYAALEEEHKIEEADMEREKKMQQAVLSIKKKFGKNAILKGMNLVDGATTRERNKQIGGHKA